MTARTRGGLAAAGVVLGLVALLAWTAGEEGPGTPFAAGEVPTVAQAVPDASGEDRGPQPNLLLVVLDDVGMDMLASYGEHPHPIALPQMEALAEEGLLFRNMVSTPLCSPTRATMLTGRYGFRYGIGGAIAPKVGWGLPTTERSLALALSEGSGGSYRSAVVGKWHLASPNMGGWDHPRAMGFDHHVGSMGNLHGKALPADEPMRYDLWTRVIDGQPMVETRYATTATTDDALEVGARLGEPWLLWVAYNAAHFPMHTPPSDLLAGKSRPPRSETEQYRQMVRALDTEVGRLVEGLRAMATHDTWIVLLADNGSAPVGVIPPWPKDQAKGALLRGGVRVPMLVLGPGVTDPGGERDALLNTTDLFATLLELAGVDGPVPEDSQSFASLLTDPSAEGSREVAFAEAFKPNGPPPWEEHRFMVRDARHKVVRERDGRTLLFDLQEDPMERHDLLGEQPTEEALAIAQRLLDRAPYDAVPTPVQGADGG